MEERIVFPGISEQARARDVFSAAMEAVRRKEERGVAKGDFMEFARKMNRQVESFQVTNREPQIFGNLESLTTAILLPFPWKIKI